MKIKWKFNFSPLLSYLLLLVSLSFLGFSCSTTKAVKPGTYLYKGSTVQFDSTATKTVEAEIRPEMESLFAPATNRTIFGLPLRLYWYNFFYGPKEKGLGKWIRGWFGDEPVLYDNETTTKVDQLMENRLFNKGFFEPSVTPELDTANKKAVVAYHINLGPRYFINAFSFDISDTLLSKTITSLYPSTLIRPGQAYDLNLLKAERERIGIELKRQGFYFFDPNYLKFAVDTSMGTYQVDVRMQLKANAPQADLQPIFINDITIYTDYQIGRPPGKDSIKFEGLTLVFNKFDMRPSRLREVIFFNQEEKYNPAKHTTTLRRLNNLSYYKFVSLRHERAPGTDNKVDVKIYLTPKALQTVEGSVGLSLISNQYIGPQVSLGYTNRNLFKGAEELRIQGSGDFNFPLRDNLNNYFEQISANISLTRPGLGIPFVSSKVLPSLIRANTRIQLEYERERIRLPLSNDQEFLDNLFFFGFDNLLAELEEDPNFSPPITVESYRLSFGYIWQRQPLITTELTPISISFQNVRYGNPDLKPLLDFIFSFDGEEQLLLNLERMIIFQPDYIFQYDTRRGPARKNNVFYRGRFSIAGNSILRDDQTNSSNAQLENFLVQVENDFRYYVKLSPRQTIASRFITNVSFPFEDRVIFSITNLYSVGGPNSIRAFYPRTLGPGTTNVQNSQFGALQGKGDIKLEGSLEFRQKFNQYVELALFADAGNIWRIEKDVDSSPTRFGFDTFFKQIAVGSGMGLRLDFSYLVLRVDLAFPLVKPWLPEGQRWVGNQIRLGDPSWRRDNLVLNLAFGYPF